MPVADPAIALSRLRCAIAVNEALIAGERFLRVLNAGFRPDQPRVPAGNPDGGQWTREGATVTRVQARSPAPRSGAPRRIAGSLRDLTAEQETRLEISHSQMQAAVRRVQSLDPNWKPRPSLYETVEGEIAANNAAAREAQDRLYELSRVGIGPGPFAVESQSARGRGRRWTAEEIRENNRIGRTYGCHTCGAKNPGTPNGNFRIDHQDPNAMNAEGRRQALFPQCARCSNRQGAWILNNYLRRK